MRTIVRPFPKPWTIAGVEHKDFELRESITDDIFKAEQKVSVDKTVTFDGALICCQLVRVGDYDGPMTLELLGTAKPDVFAALRAALTDVERDPEPKKPGEA